MDHPYTFLLFTTEREGKRGRKFAAASVCPVRTHRTKISKVSYLLSVEILGMIQKQLVPPWDIFRLICRAANPSVCELAFEGWHLSIRVRGKASGRDFSRKDTEIYVVAQEQE